MSVPFAPLTYGELLDRRRRALESCGHRCETVAEYGGTFEERDHDALLKYVTEAKVWGEAYDARTVES